MLTKPAFESTDGTVPRNGTSLNDFLDQLRQGLAAVAREEDGILLAVSGGRDSMALLQGAAKIRQHLPISGLAVAHLNHNLRGAASHRDAELIRRESTRLGVPTVIRECEPGQLHADSRGSLEESARNARYEFLRRTAEDLHLPCIATAHHAGDQAETVVHHLLRGTSLRGLQGIPVRRSLSENVALVRPMLAIAPSAIERFVADQGVPFFDDETNSNPTFTRNRIRRQLLPLLRTEFNPGVDAALVRLSQQAGEFIECLDALANQVLKLSVLEQSFEICRLDADALREWPEPLIRHTLIVLWTRCHWPQQKMTAEHWKRLAAVVTQGADQAIQLPGGLYVRHSGKILRITMQGDP
jgi:tRNA(Ile)-lysidine synthase